MLTSQATSALQVDHLQDEVPVRLQAGALLAVMTWAHRQMWDLDLMPHVRLEGPRRERQSEATPKAASSGRQSA